MSMPDSGARGETADRFLISVVVPAYNEEESVFEFHRRLSAVFAQLDHELEVIYVNDGSQDRTFETLYAMHIQDHRIKISDLSRNFGKETAMTAGLDHAKGDAVIVIDVDLQDPPTVRPDRPGAAESETHIAILTPSPPRLLRGERAGTRGGERFTGRGSSTIAPAVAAFTPSPPTPLPRKAEGEGSETKCVSHSSALPCASNECLDSERTFRQNEGDGSAPLLKFCGSCKDSFVMSHTPAAAESHATPAPAAEPIDFQKSELTQFDRDDVEAGSSIGKMLAIIFFYTFIATGIAGWWTFRAVGQ